MSYEELNTIDNGGIPSRGTILCVFQDSALVQSIEPAIARRGFSLLRARNGMHGLWMAATTKPDVIITDIPDASSESDHLLDSLQKNRRTQGVPVLALVDSTRQTAIQPTCLRVANRTLLKNSTIDSIIAAAIELIDGRNPVEPSKTMNREDRTLRVDAVFSEIGETTTNEKKFRTVYRQRDNSAFEEVERSVDAELIDEPYRKFDSGHGTDLRSFGRVTEERLRRYLGQPSERKSL